MLSGTKIVVSHYCKGMIIISKCNDYFTCYRQKLLYTTVWHFCSLPFYNDIENLHLKMLLKDMNVYSRVVDTHIYIYIYIYIIRQACLLCTCCKSLFTLGTRRSLEIFRVCLSVYSLWQLKPCKYLHVLKGKRKCFEGKA